MDTKKTLKVQKAEHILLSDKHYFNYVFKKTEKIVCAVFYILHTKKDIEGQKGQVVLNIETSAKKTLDSVLNTLSLEPHEVQMGLIDTLQALVSLQSHLFLGQSAGVIRGDLVEVLVGEIEGVQRSIARYVENDTEALFDFTPELTEGGVVRTRTSTYVRPAASQSRDTTHAEQGVRAPVRVSQNNRQDSIKEIIADKKTVSIKDLSEVIKDCSEKTIQRDLNDMIKNGVVKREGERRWSQYSLI